MSSLDISTRFEITSGSATIKCPRWFDTEGSVENDVKKGTYISFVEQYKALYVVNLEWFTNEKKGDLEDQNWVLRENNLLDMDRGYVGVYETEQVPADKKSHEDFYWELYDVLSMQNRSMFVSEKGVVADLEGSCTLRYSVLINKKQIIGFYVNLEPYDDDEDAVLQLWEPASTNKR